MSKPSGKERRRQPRVAVSLPVSVYVGSAGSESVGTVFNLSETGAFLRTARPVEPGNPIALEFEEDVIEPSQHRGRVARVDGLHGVGVEFEETSDNLRSFVRKLLGACRDMHRETGEGE